MCLHASMPVCEHVSVSSAPQMCQGPESCWGSISRSLVEEASVYAECTLSPKLPPTSASHPGVCLQITCPLPQGIVLPGSRPLHASCSCPRMAVARKEVVTGCLVQGPGKGLEWRVQRYGKATVPGLTYQPRPRSPTRRRGFPATGKEAEQKAGDRGQEGRDRQEPLVTNAVATSRSKG